MAKERVCIIGLGYVGLPLATAFATEDFEVYGYDTNLHKTAWLKAGRDHENILPKTELDLLKKINFVRNLEDLPRDGAMVYIVCVPTPIHEDKTPDLEPLKNCCVRLSTVIQDGDMVIFESTVYPGVTRDICMPILNPNKALDIDIGYSPERVNPGDPVHTVRSINKLVAGDTDRAKDRALALYDWVSPVVPVETIETAEMAKAIENAQRDINIAFVNEIAILCEKSGLKTVEVLRAASTKWNFLPFNPGLVGGHCIGVDPYYLAHHAESLGHTPSVILAGRRVNDRMGNFVARKLLKMMARDGIISLGKRVAILGATFKPNVSDYRNTRVVDIHAELKSFGAWPTIFDDYVSPEKFSQEYGIHLAKENTLGMTDTEVVILAVPHDRYLDPAFFDLHGIRPRILVDIYGRLTRFHKPTKTRYWSL